MKVYNLPLEIAARPRDAVVEVDDLWRWYRGPAWKKRFALSGVGFRVRAGEVLGLLGPNGAGKTTTLKTILGLLRPSRGRVRLFGREASDPSMRARLGFLAEQPYFYDYLTAAEFLDLCGVLCRMDPLTRRKRAKGLLERVELAAARDTRLRKFSKGMLQRLGLAQALMHEPSLVILDEPMSGLDPLGRSLVRDVILELRQKGVTVLFSSHILPDVETLCDRAVIIVGGRVVADGTIADLSAEVDTGFEILAQNLGPAVAGRLNGMGLDVRPAGLRTIVEAGDRPAMNLAVRELLAAGAEIMGISPRQSPLEARFHRAVADAAGRRDGPGSGPRPAAFGPPGKVAAAFEADPGDRERSRA